jgi:hypothetical protein
MPCFIEDRYMQAFDLWNMLYERLICAGYQFILLVPQRLGTAERMGRALSLMLTGFLLFAVLSEPAFSRVQSVQRNKPQGLSDISQTSSVPGIVVDGNLSDWAEVYPIINGTGGDRSSPYFYGITECYILVEQGQFYFVFKKSPFGSDSWRMFFDTDLSNETGYPINGMGADYMFAMSTPQGLYPWGGNDWGNSAVNLTVEYDTLHGGARTADSSLVFAEGGTGGGSGSEEWYEGRISLSLLGNPAVFGLVFELPWEHVVEPEMSYIVVSQGQSLSFAASCTAGAHTLHYGQPVDTVFNLLNFGPSNMSEANLEVDLPKELSFVSGQTTWQGTIPEGGRLTLDFEAEPRDYGQATSNSIFTCVDASSGKNLTISVPSTTETVPNVSINLKAPANMTAGVESPINITVTNLDPLRAPLTIAENDPLNLSGFLLNDISLVIWPNSTIELPSVPVDPTLSGNKNLAIIALYGEIGVGSASSSVTVNAPRIHMTTPEMPSNMQVGTTYSVSTVIENDEDASYGVSFSIDPGPGLACVNGQSVNVTLPANSNTTVTLLMKAEKTENSYATVNLNGAWGQDVYSQLFYINLEPTPINMPLIAAAVIVVLILAAVLTWKRKAVSEKLGKKV